MDWIQDIIKQKRNCEINNCTHCYRFANSILVGIVERLPKKDKHEFTTMGEAERGFLKGYKMAIDEVNKSLFDDESQGKEE